MQAITFNINLLGRLLAGATLVCLAHAQPAHAAPVTSRMSAASTDIAQVLAGATQVATGDTHSCALMGEGGVKCWGWNVAGQLGDGTTSDRSAPVDVAGLTSGVSAIAAGGNHTCALTTSGGMKCWGSNFFGQLGNGMTATMPMPVDVTGLTSGVSTISVGDGHTCAVTTGGAAKCWGWNAFGQLGNGMTTTMSTPVDVSGLSSGVRAIAAGGQFTCAVTTGGAVRCWGYNSYGQLGDETEDDRLTPVAVSGLGSGVSAVTAGDQHTCALTASGAALCWGYNFLGPLGIGTTQPVSKPVGVTGLTSGVSAISAGEIHTCAVTTGGAAKCWGSNAYGQVGNGQKTALDKGELTPVGVSGLSSGVADIAAGGNHTCARLVAGGVKCWGFNGKGQLGDGTMADKLTPICVIGFVCGAFVYLPAAIR